MKIPLIRVNHSKGWGAKLQSLKTRKSQWQSVAKRVKRFKTQAHSSKEEWAFYFDQNVPQKGTDVPERGTMIEQLVTSKTRIKILKLFLYDIDKRYYLRELERLLGESLSPLRRQLLKLVKIGILKIEDEANLKFYRLNKNFHGLEELRSLVLEEPMASIPKEIAPEPEKPAEQAGMVQAVRKQFRYDLLALTAVSIFIIITAIFIIYTSNRNFNQVAHLITDRSGGVSQAVTRSANVSGPDAMKSKKWKVSPGASSIFSEKEL